MLVGLSCSASFRLFEFERNLSLRFSYHNLCCFLSRGSLSTPVFLFNIFPMLANSRNKIHYDQLKKFIIILTRTGRVDTNITKQPGHKPLGIQVIKPAQAGHYLLLLFALVHAAFAT